MAAMASASEGEAATEERRGWLLELLMGSAEGPERDSFMFFPIIVGLLGPPHGRNDGDSSPSTPAAADRVVLVNPLTQGMVVLQAGGGGDFAAALREVLAAYGGATRGPPPASKASIEAMRPVERPTGEAPDGEEEECAVCLDGLWAAEVEKEAAVVKEMPCKHRFHGGCIEKWLRLHGSCPVCRYRMPEEKQPAQKKVGEEGEEGEEGRRRRRGLEREIWVTLGFGRRGAREQGDQSESEQQHAAEEQAQQQQ